MRKAELATGATPEALAEHIYRIRDTLELDHGAHAGPSVREETHKGHDIVVRTSYDIEVDGLRIRIPISVNRLGMVYSHALPYDDFPSAIDLVETLIDVYRDGLARRKSAPAASPDHEHEHEHEHGG